MLRNRSWGVLLLSLATVTATIGIASAQVPTRGPTTLDQLIRLSPPDAQPPDAQPIDAQQIDAKRGHGRARANDASERSHSLADLIRSQAVIYRINHVSHVQSAEEMSVDLSLDAASPDAASPSDWRAEPKREADQEEASREPVPDRSAASRLMQLRKPVTQITIQPRIAGRVTPESRAAVDQSQREAILISAMGASNPRPDRYTIGFQHRPLYYEQLNLERCGKGYGYFQNLVSGAQFLTNTMLLPYHMSEKRPDCPTATRGDCKACQSYPVKLNPLPLDFRAMTTETAALAGFSFLLL